MERVISAQGLLSLPSAPQARTFQQPLSRRFPFVAAHFTSPIFRARSPSHAVHGFDSGKKIPSPLGLSSPLYGNPRKGPTFSIGAEGPTGGAGFVDGEAVKPKFLGVEITTLKKIIPLGIMFFCILFNYIILRDTKDVLMVTAKGSSAKIIPFLKTWVNLPMAIGFMLLYTKLSNVLSKEALFYTMIFPFIAFFEAFSFLLYLIRDAIHPTTLVDRFVAALGPSFLDLVAILRIWSFCLFYVMVELWGSVVVSVHF